MLMKDLRDDGGAGAGAEAESMQGGGIGRESEAGAGAENEDGYEMISITTAAKKEKTTLDECKSRKGLVRGKMMDLTTISKFVGTIGYLEDEARAVANLLT
jgi:hypothetical protein